MAFVGKSAAPCESDPTTGTSTVDEAALGGITLFAAQPGYLKTEELSAALRAQGRTVLWMRLGEEDRDPGMFLVSLIAAARRQRPGFGQGTFELMRRQPGPLVGWPPAFALLGEELGEALPATGAVVLEHVHHLEDAYPTLQLLTQHLIPALPNGLACIITSHRQLRAAAFPGPIVRRSVRDLRIPPAVAQADLQRAALGLSSEDTARAAALCQGQGTALDAIRLACAALGPKIVQRGIARVASVQELVAFLAETWLTAVGPGARRALGLMLQLEYGHRMLTDAAMIGDAPPLGPWLQPLAGGWSRIRTEWKAPLRSLLAPKNLPPREAVHRAAEWLLEMDAAERAIPLYFKLGDLARVVRVISREAGRLMDLGQWQTLGGWLGQIPDRILTVEPWLLYDQAEIAAAHGRTTVAWRRFSTTASLFARQHDANGACQSMLAESSMALGEHDLSHAWRRALAASAMADAAGLERHQAWASWQLGRLASITGNIDDALTYFDRAVAAAFRSGERPLVEIVLEADRLTRSVQELHQRRERHREAEFALEHAEQEATMRLRAHLGATSEGPSALLGAYGWSRTPLPFKAVRSPQPLRQEGTGWWSKVRRAFAPRSRASQEHGWGDSWAGSIAPEADRGRRSAPEEVRDAADVHTAASVAANARLEPAARATLVVHLLGELRVVLNDTSVDDWPSGRGRSLFKYLLTHRDPWQSRDTLVEVFWPGSAPEAARNSFNVAVHGLRLALRAASDVPVVVLEGGTYRLNHDLELWLDIDEFERHVEAGKQLEAAGELAGAMAEHELAVSLYQGDFLADDPYEEWAVLFRERMRLAYLDTLERLSHLYFSRGSYVSCATLCQRIIERDPCREDAHRHLMRCYSRQGQPHLAMRQYRACLDSLSADLGIGPTPVTTQLYERIRRHEPV
jgi:DNA-binding SARP family transcriptional activator